MLAVERVLFQVNVRTAMSVGQASGWPWPRRPRRAARSSSTRPNQVKQAVAGYGARRQGAGAAWCRRCSGWPSRPDPADAADAAALALCHLRPLTGADAGAPTAIGVDAVIGSLRGTLLDRDGTRGARRGRRRRLPGHGHARPPWSQLGDVGDEVFVYIHHHIREDAQTLYGFPAATSATCFEALLGAHGVGPALALAILSVHAPVALRLVLADDDVDALCLVPGVGKKTAARLLIELKSRLELAEVDLTDAAIAVDGDRSPASRRARRRARGAGRPRLRPRRDRRRRCATCPTTATASELLRAALQRLAAA